MADAASPFVPELLIAASGYVMECHQPPDTVEHCRCSMVAQRPVGDDHDAVSTRICSNDCSFKNNEGEEATWQHIPSVILEGIFRSMTYCECLRISSTCKHWRSVLYSPSLWSHIDLTVHNIREGKKAFFLAKCIRFAKYVRIYWPAVIKRGQIGLIRPMDLNHKETLKSLIEAMRECENLGVMVLKLENPCAFTPDFSQPVQASMRVICKRNANLTTVSFGCNGTIIPAISLDLLANLCTLNELHIARYKPTYSTSGMDSVPVLCVDDFASFSHMTALKELTIDWCNVSPGVIQGFACSASSLNKLNIIMSAHNCSPSAHPSESDWDEFARVHVDVRISVTFVRQLCGACDSLELIRPTIHVLKVLECSYIDPDDYTRLLHGQRDSLQALVHVGIWDSIELVTAPALWPPVSACQAIKHLAFIGHFILDEILLFLVSRFDLETLVITRPHVMVFAEASPYLVPTSAGKYHQFKQDMSTILKRPWEATSQVPLEGFYFAEGKDDSVYMTGS